MDGEEGLSFFPSFFFSFFLINSTSFPPVRDTFQVKKKTKQEKESEERAFEDWQKTIRTEKTLKKKADVLEDFWNITDDIDDDEKFLRDYILNERWKEDSKPG